jgi:RNA polymerase sigma-70 factor (ECF subfamily)
MSTGARARPAACYPLTVVPEETTQAEPGRPGVLEPASLPEHASRLYRAAHALSGSSTEAEDLVQETFARVLARPRKVRRGGERAYLMRVLRNTWIDFQRARAARPDPAGGEAIDWVLDVESDPGGLALDVKLAYEGMRELPDPQREAIVAVDILGLAYKEAARALSIRKGTLMSRLARARERVAREMEAAS